MNNKRKKFILLRMLDQIEEDNVDAREIVYTYIYV